MAELQKTSQLPYASQSAQISETSIEEGSQLITGREGKDEIKNELAEIEILMEKLANSKNRKEKRRLMAIYN